MGDFFETIMAWADSTNIPGQLADVDVAGLFSNPWFLVPFIAAVGYFLFRQAWKDLILMAIFISVWWASGTEYMNTLVVGDELQINKILPVLFGGAGILGFIIYMFFGRSD